MLSTIEKQNLISKGQKIIVGVSGGSDSMALLNGLLAIRDTWALQIVVVHVHHGLRGAFADRDMAFVREFCAINELPFIGFREDVDQLAKKMGKSLEEAGRDIRYCRFEEIRQKYNADAIAVAHHQGDVVETFWFNLFRGAGLDGLASIAYRRAPYIIRPLLDCKKSELIAFLSEIDCDYVTDETNEDLNFSRNKIRNEWIPYLNAMLEFDMDDQISKLSSRFKDEKIFWEAHCAKLVQNITKKTIDGLMIDQRHWDKLEIAEKRYLIRYITKLYRGNLSNVNSDVIERVLSLQKTGKLIEISPELRWIKLSDGIGVVLRKNDEKPIDVPTLEVTYMKASERSALPLGNLEILVDADKLVGKIYLRKRKEGDRFFPLGSPGQKKLKDFFIDQKIPQHLRDDLWIVCDEEKIIWIPELRMSENVKITKQTQNLALIRL